MWVCVCWDADTARVSLQSDPFGRESRTNQIIVLVWHWVDPSVGQWADYPGWEWEWLNSELHPNEYIMSPLSLSTPLWNKEMRSTSALMRWWNSTSLFHHKARLMAMQIAFSNKEIGVENRVLLMRMWMRRAPRPEENQRKIEMHKQSSDCLSTCWNISETEEDFHRSRH